MQRGLHNFHRLSHFTLDESFILLVESMSGKSEAKALFNRSVKLNISSTAISITEKLV